MPWYCWLVTASSLLSGSSESPHDWCGTVKRSHRLGVAVGVVGEDFDAAAVVVGDDDLAALRVDSDAGHESELHAGPDHPAARRGDFRRAAARSGVVDQQAVPVLVAHRDDAVLAVDGDAVEGRPRVHHGRSGRDVSADRVLARPSRGRSGRARPSARRRPPAWIDRRQSTPGIRPAVRGSAASGRRHRLRSTR